MKSFVRIIIYGFIIFLTGCTNGTSTDTNNNNHADENKVAYISYSVVSVLPHDTSFFTEGLEFYKNTLLESTGNYKKSKLVQTDVNTGKVLKQVILDEKQFGEGISVLRDTLYQLTYKEHVVNLYSAADFKKIKQLPFNAEGWGMTNDGKDLIASDGSSNLFFYEPSTFRLLRVQNVTENGSTVPNINELEYIDGFIYANQWQYNDIIKINPSTGEVVAKIDLTELVNKVPRTDPQEAVLNGIAYNPVTKKIYVTGKYWPTMYEVRFAH